MFGRLGTQELLLILGIALVIFGPGKLPEIGKSFGKAIGEFKNHASKISKDVEEAEEEEK
ncbi:MAG TPA: twin-arginine translocase TatA/TatE family subunit [Clostridia bacterium]|nr:twin-arginine translocase TatA/TatE family subunit [Clostridia bacterium]